MNAVEIKRRRMLIPISARTQNGVREFGIQAGDSRSSMTLVGQILDSKSATVGSLARMIEKLGAKETGDSTLRCAKDGSFVLYDSETKTIYPFNDEEKPVRDAGQKVKGSETHAKWSQIVDIKSIVAANPDFLKFNSILFSHGFVRN